MYHTVIATQTPEPTASQLQLLEEPTNMTADEFQEPVDCCKWRRLQRADGDWYNCKIEDCRNWACKYSTTNYVPSGPDVSTTRLLGSASNISLV